MDVWTVVSLAVRWVHAMTAAVWVGGGVVYLIVVAPPLRSRAALTDAGLSKVVVRRFSRIVGGGIGVFILTGAIMTLERLAAPGLTAAYVAVLGLKIALSLLAFGLVWRRGAFFFGWEGGRIAKALSALGTTRDGLAVALGLVVYLLAIILKFLVEASLGVS